jgi:hypothetical protein
VLCVALVARHGAVAQPLGFSCGHPRRSGSRTGGGHGGGEGIIPMSSGEALEWAERCLPVEAVEQHFGGAIEDA